MNTNIKKYIIIALRVIVAIILVQTLTFKLSAHPDSIYIFEKAGLGDTGRIGIAIVELIAAILILIPRTAWLGSGITLGVISGAVMMHLTKLGINVNGDGGTMFSMALFIFISSIILTWNYRKDIPIIGSFFIKNK